MILMHIYEGTGGMQVSYQVAFDIMASGAPAQWLVV
jgi:hypothetical protein